MTTIPKLALLLPLLAASPVLAQGTEAQRAACGPDAFRLCASSIPDPGRTAACLGRERERLSPGCRAMFDAVDAKTRTAAAPKPAEAATPVRVARADGERRSTAPRLPRQEAAATPRAEPRRTARVASLDRPARAASRVAAGPDAFGSFSGLEAQAHGWHRTLAGYADSIERRFARLGSVDTGRLDLGRLPGL